MANMSNLNAKPMVAFYNCREGGNFWENGIDRIVTTIIIIGSYKQINCDFCKIYFYNATRIVLIAETFPRKKYFWIVLQVETLKDGPQRDFLKKPKQIKGWSVFTVHYYILIRKGRKSAKFSWNSADHWKLVLSSLLLLLQQSENPTL